MVSFRVVDVHLGMHSVCELWRVLLISYMNATHSCIVQPVHQRTSARLKRSTTVFTQTADVTCKALMLQHMAFTVSTFYRIIVNTTQDTPQSDTMGHTPCIIIYCERQL